MKKNIFDEEQNVSEYDMLGVSDEQAEEIGRNTDRFIQQTMRSETPVSVPDVAYELEEEEMDVVGEAMVRLEQARLYDMLIKHNMFEGVDANPIALQKVQNELKQYIVERLQILLGIKQEKHTPSAPVSMRVELPFNKMEVQALKDLAYKLTKGATTSSSDKEYAEAVSEEREEPAPKKLAAPPKPQGLKSLGKPKQAAPPAPARKETPVVVNKQKKVKIPDIGTKTLRTPDGEVVEEDLIEEAKRQLEEELSRASASKNPYDMTREELMERNSQIKGQKRSTKVRGIPAPTPDQVNMMYQAKQMNRIQNDTQMTSILSRVLEQQK